MGLLSDLPLPATVGAWVVVGVAICIFYGISLTIQRLWFHPLRKIPGPWYARASYWYEFYQDCILGGNYVKDYPRIHAEYGKYS